MSDHFWDGMTRDKDFFLIKIYGNDFYSRKTICMLSYPMAAVSCSKISSAMLVPFVVCVTYLKECIRYIFML